MLILSCETYPIPRARSASLADRFGPSKFPWLDGGRRAFQHLEFGSTAWLQLHVEAVAGISRFAPSALARLWIPDPIAR